MDKLNMCEKEEKICRLCLRITDNDCEVIDEVAIEMFNCLLLQVNLDTSKQPVICKNCAENVQKGYNFKCTCLSTEDLLLFTVTDNSAEPNLKDLFLMKSGNVDKEFPIDHNVCRLCLQCQEQNDFIRLTDLKEHITFAGDMITKCIPEMKFDAKKEPLICTGCLESLESYYNFATTYWNLEERISEYCTLKGTTIKNQTLLGNILPFSPGDLQPKVDVHSEIAIIKEEAPLEDIQYTQVNDPVIKIEKQELIIKDENTTDCQDCEKPARGKRHRCEICGFETKQKGNLNVHMLIHKAPSDVRMYKCHICTLETKYKTSLKVHMLTHRDPDSTAMYVCKLCKFQTKHRYNLKYHMETHKRSPYKRMYKCDKCSYDTHRQVNLEKHVLIHEGHLNSKTYKCESCSFETKHRSSFNDHVLVHKDDSSAVIYKCDECPYQTKYRNNLTHHVLVHKAPSDVVMHKCQLCKFETKYKRSLKTHELVHRNPLEVVMFKCEICEYETRYKGHLIRHMTTH